jgi:peptidoglycan/xylan/chitin deacetylase (PgdA/CDA1 family)
MLNPQGNGEDVAAAPASAGRASVRTRVAIPIAAAGAGAAVMPALAMYGGSMHASAMQVGVAALLAVLAVGAASRLANALLLPVAVVVGGTAAWLLAQASYPAAAWVVAPSAGIAAGLCWPGRARASSLMLPPVAVAGALTALELSAGRDASMAAGAAVVAIAAVASAFASPAIDRRWLRVAPLAIGALLVAAGTSAFVGATTPRVTWFGSLVHHGPRNGTEVAITFDDGPDPPYTLQIRDILDRYGVKATFFTVGKALDARPDVSKALLDDGQLLGNHSYHHDAWRWLDPRYPELDATQQAFKRQLGVCPGFYRPPHGSHTPFIAHVVGDSGMTMVTWDVSAGDWATGDGALVAKRVLDHVRPGSIILLHDGIDGHIGADRSVILDALPRILDGLRARGLKPVRLDELLGLPGYVDSC